MTASVYNGLAGQHQAMNRELAKRVTEAIAVEKLFLLGLTTGHRRTETLFSVPSASRTEVTHYYLLALVEKEDDHSLNSLQDKIENTLQRFIPVTAIVLSGAQFIAWLLQGHSFAAAVREKAGLLYQKDEQPLPFPAPVNKEEMQKKAAALYKQTKTKVEEFLAGAELYTVRVQYKMAAFMLHQAAEQALRAMLWVNTGLRVNTHSIEKLLRYCTLFCFRLPELFPKQKEKRLFGLLQKAYIEARYREEYSIGRDDLAALTVKVKMIQALFEQYAPGPSGLL